MNTDQLIASYEAQVQMLTTQANMAQKDADYWKNLHSTTLYAEWGAERLRAAELDAATMRGALQRIADGNVDDPAGFARDTLNASTTDPITAARG